MATENPFARVFYSSNANASASSTIRLAVLNAGQTSDTLRLSLINADPEDTVYDCISYDRSTDTGTVEVQVDDKPFSIPIPLEAALRRMRSNDRPRTLWADLLIGNTEEERSGQASELKTVFENAQTVVARLDPGSALHDGVVDLLKSLASRWYQAQAHTNFPEYQNRATQKQLMDAHALINSKSLDDLHLTDTALWQATANIFNSSYFETTQSIPDLVLAKKAVIAIGDQTISWQDFNAALMAYMMVAPTNGIPLSPDFLNSHQRISRLELATLRKKNGDSLELLAMMKDARRTTCTDPREIIFSLLPIITPCERTKGTSKQPTRPAAEYSKKVTDVFKEASKYILEERQDVMLWFNERPPCGRRISGIPSWAIDFTSSLPPDAVYSARAQTNGLREWADPLQSKPVYVDASDGLHLQAHALDRIVWVSKPFTEENCRRLCLEEWQKIPTLPGESLADKIAKVWRTLCLNTASGMGETGLSVPIPPKEMWQSFQSLLAEERILELLKCTWEELANPSDDLKSRAQTNPDVVVLGPQTGQSAPFEGLLRKSAIGRRFFQTGSGRVGLTSVEDPVPGPVEGDEGNSAASQVNFDAALSDPIGQMMMGPFQEYVAQRDPNAARVLAQALSGSLPGQRSPGVRSGDLVVAIVGGFQPYILRPVSSNDDSESGSGTALGADSKYTYVGDCYMHGVMDGECFKESVFFGLSTRYRQNIETVDITIV